MKSLSTTPTAPAAASITATDLCPLNHGLAVLDQMLAAMAREGDAAGLDVALDFRLLLAASPDAAVVLREFFGMRRAIEVRHYLACYRLRRWLEAHFVAHVQLCRTQPSQAVALRLDAASFDDLCAHCTSLAADGAAEPAWSRVRFSAVSPS